jgi:hypothetical protein
MKVLIRSNMTPNALIGKEKAIISDGLSCVAPLTHQSCSTWKFITKLKGQCP